MEYCAADFALSRQIHGSALCAAISGALQFSKGRLGSGSMKDGACVLLKNSAGSLIFKDPKVRLESS